MKITLDIPHFKCPQSIAPHLTSVFEGEYDVPLEFGNGGRGRILDLGANVGAFAIWASHRWPGTEIICYEPHPKNVELLRTNVRNYPNVTIKECGIGDPGFRALFEGLHNCGEHSFHRMLNNPTSHGQHIEVMSPLTLPQANILKMDIEGCEIEVLPVLLKDGREFDGVVFEYHCEKFRRELDQLLEQYTLIGHKMYSNERGTVRYIRKDLL